MRTPTLQLNMRCPHCDAATLTVCWPLTTGMQGGCYVNRGTCAACDGVIVFRSTRQCPRTRNEYKKLLRKKGDTMAKKTTPTIETPKANKKAATPEAKGSTKSAAVPTRSKSTASEKATTNRKPTVVSVRSGAGLMYGGTVIKARSGGALALCTALLRKGKLTLKECRDLMAESGSSTTYSLAVFAKFFEDKGVPHVKKDGAKGLIYIDKFDPSKVTMGSAPAKKAKAAKPVEPEDDEEEDLEDEEEPTTGSIEDEDTDEEDEEDFDDED